MSSIMGLRHVGCLAILISGCLAACGRTSNDGPGMGVAGASGADAVAGAPEIGGAATNVGGAATSVAGAAHDGKGGSDNALGDAGNAGDAGSNAGTSGGPSGGAKGMVVEPYFHAGSRLKPRVFSAGDLEVIDGNLEAEWHDAKTGDPCMFRVGADGIERCLPAYEFDEDADSNPLSYLDAACTHPAVPDGYDGRCASEGPHYLTVRPASGCSYRTYRLGAPQPNSTRLYAKHGTSCARQTPANGDDILPLEEEVPLETFVAVKEVSRPRHPRMNAWVREGEDGSSQVIGFSQPGHDGPCFGLGLDVSPQLCVPAWLPNWGYFSDATCTQRAGLEPDDRARCTSGTSSALLNTTTSTESCKYPYSVAELWQLGGATSTLLYDNSDGMCATRFTEPSVVRVQGAAIDLASLPKLDVIEVGNGPLKRAFFGYDGVPFYPALRTMGGLPDPGPFIDVARGEPCDPHVFADGVWRCIPASFQRVMDFDFFYESEDCTGPRAYSPTPNGSAAYCEYADRKPRGVFVQSLLPSVCRDYLVTETLELEGESSATYVSHHGLSSTCSSRPFSAAFQLLKVSKQLNPADVFVAMERKIKD